MKQFLLITASIFFVLQAWTQTARLDPSFAGKGWTYVDMPKDNYYSESAIEILPQANGHYLVVFEINSSTILTRYQPNGSRDLSFGTEGFSESTGFYPTAATLQSDGKIVVAGLDYNPTTQIRDIAVARFNPDGTLDKSFGDNGQFTLVTNGEFYKVHDVALQSNGRILLGGTAAPYISADRDFFLLRLLTNGAIDNSFDSDGMVVTPIAAYNATTGLALQADGKIIMVGTAPSSENNASGFAVMRYNPNGSLDNSFSGDGRQYTYIGQAAQATDVVVRSNGKIVVAGQAQRTTQDHNNFAVARYNTDGSLDNGFSGDGIVITDFGYHSHANAVKLSNDNIVVSGEASDPSSSAVGFAVARYHSNGSPDNSFSGDGKVTTLLDEFTQAHSLFVDNSGKVVVAGSTSSLFLFLDMAIVRYNTNGTLDNSFDGDGQLIDYYPAGEGVVSDMAIQKDGKIVLAGYYYTNPRDEDRESTGFALTRLNPDGTVDHSFGTNGTVTTRFNIDDQITAIAIQEDGKIVAVGFTSYFDFQFSDFVVARYNPDGSLDNSFGTNGTVITGLGGEMIEDFAYDVALQPDGKIVVAGSSTQPNGFVVLRYNTNGTLDNSFDGDGIVTTDFGNYEEAQAILLQPDGKLVVAGRAAISSTNDIDFALARYNPDGSLDLSFDGDGRQTTDIYGRDEATSIILQGDGKIIVGGNSSLIDFNMQDFALARYNIDGSLDLSFDEDGKQRTDFGNDDLLFDLTLQEDGKLIAVGQTGNFSTFLYHFAIARYNTNGTLDNSFDGDGKLDNDPVEWRGARAVAIDNNRLYVAGISGGPTSRGILAAYELGCVEQVYYRDWDRDGYGDATHKRTACSRPDGYVTNNKDCNDHNAAVHPDAKEICGNRRDNNCDGQIDEGCPGKPMITITDVVAYEADGKANLTVKLSKKSDKTVKVAYRTMTGTANRFDYVQKAGTVSIQPGLQAATITIQLIKDNVAEGEEYFKVELLHASGAELHHKDDGRITIKDATPTLSPDLTQAENLKQIETTEHPIVQKLTVKALPNPSRSYFTLQLHSASEGAVTLTVTDAAGRVVERRTGVIPNASLQLGQHYRPGLYYLQVVQGSETSVLTLIKQAN